MMSQPNPGMHAAGGPPPVLVYVPMQVQPTVYAKYASKQSIGTGIAQVVIGTLCIIFNIVTLAVGSYYDNYGVVGHGFWCGTMFIVTGGIGIGAGKRKTKCLIVAYMVLGIISASFTIGLLTVGILGACSASDAVSYSSPCYDYGYSYYYPYYSPPCGNGVPYQAVMAMEILLAVSGVVEAIIAIYGSVICCKSGVCCCSNPVPPTAIPGGYSTNNGQLVFINQTTAGQYVYLPQPMMPGSATPPPPYVPTYAQTGWSIPSHQVQAAGIASAGTDTAPQNTAAESTPEKHDQF